MTELRSARLRRYRRQHVDPWYQVVPAVLLLLAGALAIVGLWILHPLAGSFGGAAVAFLFALLFAEPKDEEEDPKHE